MNILKKIKIKYAIAVISAAAVFLIFYWSESYGYDKVINLLTGNEDIVAVLDNYFTQRCAALVKGDPSLVEGQFDKTSTYGRWSYEHEVTRIKLVKQWAEARGIEFKDCQYKFKIFSIKKGEDSVRIYMSVRTKLSYIYKDLPETINEFSLGTRHTLKLVNRDDNWYVTVDWYSDPLEDTQVAGTDAPLPDVAIETSTAYAKVKYNREKAVEYADKYSGANWDLDDGYKYNTKYRNYADLGGDCANFASQALSDKNAGGLRMGGNWKYYKGSGSRAWVNAGSFTQSLLYSGRARLVAKGKYDKVVNSIKNISPGDIISYEKKGDIVHVSIVTAIDSKGIPLVNSHTNDRYHVPWDLGWGDKGVNFWLLRIND
ncbi:putative amidase domain protein [Oxobacter pfennigii]|uniref:Putative amidase domain protein n=1 Tax=Oxobacter pfennigii TaxID=36849 RepID=A0A0P8WC38_9CLOT|nr:amidase domain-containing protein [Oxobacter pfennigii]KPU46301.1 putative amidase domain protein [Oxobacter pfennigii]